MTAEVYEWGQDRVIKLYYDWYQPDWIRFESEIGKAVTEAGVPAPTVYGMVEEGERVGLVYERITGSSMFTIMQASPTKIFSCAREMARLHYNIHSCSTTKLPRQKVKLEQAIRDSSEILKEKTEIICKVLHTLPEGNWICHGDFHPDNIIMSEAKSIAIDWTNACVGDPLCDAARTCLMFRTPFIPPVTSKSMTVPIRLAKMLLHSIYINEYLKLSKARLDDIDSWMLPVAAARLREKIPGEQAWLLDLIHKRLKHFA